MSMLRPLLSERARKDHHATPAPHPLLPRVGPAQQNREGGKKDFEEDSPPNSFMTQLWRNGNVNSGEMCGWHRGHLSEWERHHLAPHCPRKHCPTSAKPQKVQNSKNILQQTLEIKQAVPCLLTDPCISWRFPGYHFVLRRLVLFAS